MNIYTVSNTLADYSDERKHYPYDSGCIDNVLDISEWMKSKKVKLIDYTKEIPKIVKYAKDNGYETILSSIWSAYYQRKLVNTIFTKYYEKVSNLWRSFSSIS